MARITTITNQKGGVGKTTTAHALATGLGKFGKKVLVIDIDPQGNISYTMGADDQLPCTYHLLKGEISAAKAVQSTPQGDIIPGNLLLAGADMEFNQTGREFLLRDSMGGIEKQYDHIIIDTPPTIGILTINALTASTDVVIPMGADIYSLQGLSQLYATIGKVKKYCNRELSIAGLLMTRFNGRTILAQDLRENIEEKAAFIGSRLFRSYIREGVAVKEAQTQQTSIFDSAPKSNPAQDYLAFVREYLQMERK